MGDYRIGCSGWSYTGWVGRFYPRGIRSGDMLAQYADQFDTVEIDMTFYRYPSARMVEGWFERTPDDFIFAAKMNRAITHYRKLKNTGRLSRSFIQVMSGLRQKLGPVLVQLPPDLGPDHRLLEEFLSELPDHMDFVIEFRDLRWLTPRTFTLLERYEVALCLTDTSDGASRSPLTTDFAYVRWHGRSGPGYDYSQRDLLEWARALEALDVERVFGYFNNDVGAAAPRNAQTFLSMLKGEPVTTRVTAPGRR